MFAKNEELLNGLLSYVHKNGKMNRGKIDNLNTLCPQSRPLPTQKHKYVFDYLTFRLHIGTKTFDHTAAQTVCTLKGTTKCKESRQHSVLLIKHTALRVQ